VKNLEKRNIILKTNYLYLLKKLLFCHAEFISASKIKIPKQVANDSVTNVSFRLKGEILSVARSLTCVRDDILKRYNYFIVSILIISIIIFNFCNKSSADSNILNLAESLTLEQCIDIALMNNPDIKINEQMIKEYTAKKDMVSGTLFPNIKGTAGYTHYLDNQRFIPVRSLNEPGLFTNDMVSGEFIIQMPIFDGGKIINEIKSIELLQQAQEHLLSQTKKQLIFNISSVYYSILKQQMLIESLDFSYSNLKEHLKKTIALKEAKKAAKVDILRIEVRLSDIEHKLLKEKNEIIIKQIFLINLLGIKQTDSFIKLKGNLQEINLENINTDIEQNLNKAYKNRSDYKQAIKEVQAQEKKLESIKSVYIPDIILQGSYGLKWAPTSTEQQTGASNLDDAGKIAVFLTMPIFDWNVIGSQIKQEEYKLNVKQEIVRKIELKINLEVETAILNIKSNLSQIKALEKSIEQAKESLNIEQNKYELAKGTIIDVLDAQAELLNAQTNYYNSLANYKISVAQLNLSCGGEE